MVQIMRGGHEGNAVMDIARFTSCNGSVTFLDADGTWRSDDKNLLNHLSTDRDTDARRHMSPAFGRPGAFALEHAVKLHGGTFEWLQDYDEGQPGTIY